MSTNEQHKLLSEPYTQPQSNRFGIIRFTSELLYHILPDIKIEDCDTNGYLRNQGVFTLLRDKLLLPESYVIHGILLDRSFKTWLVLVESPDLPEVEETELPPFIELTYGVNEVSEQNAERTVYLMRIDVHAKEKMTVYPSLNLTAWPEEEK